MRADRPYTFTADCPPSSKSGFPQYLMRSALAPFRGSNISPNQGDETGTCREKESPRFIMRAHASNTAIVRRLRGGYLFGPRKDAPIPIQG